MRLLSDGLYWPPHGPYTIDYVVGDEVVWKSKYHHEMPKRVIGFRSVWDGNSEMVEMDVGRSYSQWAWPDEVEKFRGYGK